VAAKVKLAQLLGPPLPSDVAAARADVAKAKGDLAALLARSSPASTFDLRLGQLKVKAAEQKLAVARFASRQLTVRAESPGTVTSVLTEPGAPVDGTTPIATVTDLGKLDVRVDLSEFDVARVKRGQPAKVSIDALGGASYPGVVRFAALTGTDNGGVVTFPVIVGLKPVKDVKPGMNVSVRIIVAKRHNVPQVPLEAVTHNDEDRPVVTVINNSGQTSTKPVTLGLANNKSVQIVKGVQPGQRLVLPASGGDEG
jgi:HlyD family secretion protein